MAQLSEIVESLELTLRALLKKHESLQLENKELASKMAKLKEQHQQAVGEAQHWKDKFEAAQMANAVLGSDQIKRETKLKINALVREIDQCIAQLSE